MTHWPVILRIVLSLALVLDGIGGAMAATRMQMATSPAQVAGGAMSHTTAGMPCHEHGAMGAAASPGQPQKAPAAPDCCKGGVCICACVSIVQAVFLSPFLAAPAWGHVLVTKPLSLGHADPALPHLIRPPIG